MRAFRISVRIDAPAERVWQVMSDVERWHEWTPSVTSIRRLDDGPLALGSVALIRQPRFPPAKWKVTELEPARGFTWVSAAPGVRVVARHSIAADGAGSVATLALDYHGMLGGVLGRLTRNITERYLAYEARGLKARSEDPHFRHAAGGD
ncbi:MAG: SRPBCC family protein [Acidobacteriota bacterium]|jgi:uncharacterized membrane protein